MSATLSLSMIHYYRATGKTKLLGVAARLANLMAETMGPLPKKNVIPGHALAEKSFVDMYELFQEKPELKSKISSPVDEVKYLHLAEFWIDARGHHEGRTSFGVYDQDEIPVLQQETIEGHAVRAVLLCGGLLAVGRASDKPEYLDVAKRLWENMVSRRMYLTGGVGAMPDDEKFGADFFLPNDGYAETCASVGAVYGIDMDRFNIVKFNSISTRSIRLEVQLQPGWSGGLLKLTVN